MELSKYSKPFVQRQVNLYTQSAQDLVGYLRDIDRALSRAYKFCNQLSNGNFEKLESLIDNIFKTLEDDLRQGIKELESRCAEARAVSLSYTMPFNKTVNLTQTGTFRFIDLLLSFDTLMRSADKLWFAKLMDDSDHHQFRKNWRIKFLNLKKNIEQLARWEKISELLGSPKDSVVQVTQNKRQSSAFDK